MKEELIEPLFDKVIYKYRNWESKYHQAMLLKNELYLARPSSFNDPFDCCITTNFGLLKTKAERQVYVNSLAIKMHDYAVVNGHDLPRKMLELDERLEDISTFQAENDELENSMYDEKIGIISLSKRWDSILMWAHYAQNHYGICIGFHEEKLRKSGLFGGIGDVFYSSDFPQIHPMHNNSFDVMKMKISYKAEDWRYEQEYRLLKGFEHPTPDDSPERVVQIPDEFIAEVLLGLRVAPKVRNEILEVAGKKNVPVFQIKKVPFAFRLERELLS